MAHGPEQPSGESPIIAVPAFASDATEFTDFAADAERRLRRAFIAAYGVQRAADATAEALAWAWEHRERLRAMENPVGYLYRVGQSRTRSRRRPTLPPPEHLGVPEVEPRLISALAGLPDRQRTAVWLVHGCDWTHREVGEALGVSTSAISTHVSRGMERLRTELEVERHG